MGTALVADAVKIRDNVVPDRYAEVTANRELRVITPAAGAVVTPPTASSATGSVVSVGVAVTALLAANASRKGGLIQNHDSTVLGVGFVAGTTFANAPVKLAQYQALELGEPGAVYTGGVWGIRAGSTGDAGATEE